jgi:hypothetical protein
VARQIGFFLSQCFEWVLVLAKQPNRLPLIP